MRAILFGLLVAACSSTPPAPAGTTTVAGEVLSVDLEPMTYDGSAVIMLRTEAGEQRVEIPARTNLCQADGLDIALAAQPGDRLTVTGEQTGGALVPCADPSHAVRRG